VTVADFPHGQGGTRAAREAALATVDDGAAEVDLVVNVGRLKAGADDRVRERVAAVVDAADVPVKVIVEAPLLTDAELHRAGELAADAGADFLKTATGFADGGATVPDVELLAEYLPVKASGGVGSWDEAAAMVRAGAERIGASSGATIVEEWHEAGAPSLAEVRGED
jgi:deoxyribose-phosphate aldolase